MSAQLKTVLDAYRARLVVDKTRLSRRLLRWAVLVVFSQGIVALPLAVAVWFLRRVWTPGVDGWHFMMALLALVNVGGVAVLTCLAEEHAQTLDAHAIDAELLRVHATDDALQEVNQLLLTDGKRP